MSRGKHFKTERRCDARCHNARGPKCDCWCMGRYHGKGSDGARVLFLKDFGLACPKGKAMEDPRRQDDGQGRLFK